MTRLLVVSSDNSWNEYLLYELGAGGIEILGAHTCDEALSKVRGNPADYFGGVLIDSGPRPGRTQDEAALEAADLLTALRQETKTTTPILLWSRYPVERLSRIAKRFNHISLLSDDTLTTINAALAAASGMSDEKPRFAKIELEIGAASLRMLVTVEGKGTIAEMSRPSTRRPKLNGLEEKFRTWALWQRDSGQPPRYTDYWAETFRDAGQQLADELDYNELRNAITDCIKHVDELKKVHFRFSLLAADADAEHPYVHVPFELLYDTVKKDFVRSLAPVARRICLKPASVTSTPLVSTQTFTGPFLFVKSDAHGSFVMPGTRFGGNPELILSPLESLDEEFSGARSGRADAKPSLNPPILLELTSGAHAIEALQGALGRSPEVPEIQIVHFAGHSVQADDGSVYLILPGGNPGQLVPLAMRAFAAWARGAGVQLVLLSSCQSSSPDAVFRLAQAGIPAVIGFRWEVDDKEAAYFTGRLHKILANSTPLARAFHAAICAVQTLYPGTPTFASPMLVVQNEEWTI
jgi:hypothetical protein